MGMTLAAMTLMARRETGEEWSAKARAMVDGLIDLAVDEGEIAYFWPSAFRAVRDRPAATEPPTTEENGEACRLPYGLVHACRLLGHEPALPLAGKNLRYLRRYFFREDGSFLREPGDPMTVHFHEHSRAILTMLEYAASAGGDETILRSGKGYAVQVDCGSHGGTHQEQGSLRRATLEPTAR